MNDQTIKVSLVNEELQFKPDPCTVKKNHNPQIFWKLVDRAIKEIARVHIGDGWDKDYQQPHKVNDRKWKVKDENLKQATYKYEVTVVLESGKELCVDPEIQNMGQGGTDY